MSEPTAARPSATFNDLIKKPKRESTFLLPVTDDAGRDADLVIRYRAISSRAYDDLVAAHPPTEKQKKDGSVYNIDTFAPALISAVSLDPKLSVEQANEIYTSDDWSPGELGTLFINALKLCNAGMDVPFSVAG